MPYFTDGPAGPNPSAISLDDLPASAPVALSAGVDSAWDSNPSVLAHDWWKLRSANVGERLDNAAAAATIKQAGVKLSVPADGYTQAALDILIRRKQDDAERQDILARAPTSFVPTSTRFVAQLATGLADPLNIAAGFVPVVGEARVASMLGRAGESLLARGAARAGIGAAEGAVGVGLLEPFAYGAHQQLQDDYSMVDSLRNVGFGALLGGTLHVGGGLVADTLRVGPHPAARFGDMSVGDVQLALNFERERPTMTPEDQARALETFTPQMRRAVEERAPGDALASAPDTSAVAVASRLSPEIRETAMRSAVADFVNGRFADVDAVAALQPRVAADVHPFDMAFLHDEHNVNPEARAYTMKTVDAVREAQGLVGLTRLEHIAGERVAHMKPHPGWEAAEAAQIEMAARKVVDFYERVPDLAQRVAGTDAGSLDAVRATSERQAAPDSLAVGDFFSARAADELLAQAPRSARQEAADTALAAAMDRVQALHENLVLGGMDPAVSQSMVDSLRPWDAGIADAENLGRAAHAAALCGLRA